MSPRGGKRPGAGRLPKRGQPASYDYTVSLPEAVHAELEAGRLEHESLADVLIEGGLALVRSRTPGSTRRTGKET